MAMAVPQATAGDTPLAHHFVFTHHFVFIHTRPNNTIRKNRRKRGVEPLFFMCDAIAKKLKEKTAIAVGREKK
jgi:hypothetical protein